jgi:hypothetical protein
MELEDRVGLGQNAVDAFCKDHPDYKDKRIRKQEGESVIVDCIGDILHYAIQNGLVKHSQDSVEKAVRMAADHVIAERGL